MNLKFEQVLDLVRQLSPKEKIKLSKELEREAKEKKLTSLLQAFNTDQLTEEDISQEIEGLHYLFVLAIQ